MKYLKWTSIAFIISCVFSSAVAVAYRNGYQSIVGVTLPRWGGEITASTQTKEYDGEQYYRSSGTVDNTTSAMVNVKAKTKSSNGTTGFITLSKNETKSWGSNAINVFAGESYDLILRREKGAITTASHSGGWYLDNRAL